MLRFFHTTNQSAADQILAHGFRDHTGSYMFVGVELTGVWLSDVPVDANEGAKGEVLLVVDLDVDAAEIADCEAVEKRQKCYREWIIPASLINSRGSVRLASEAEEQEGRDEWDRRENRILARVFAAEAKKRQATSTGGKKPQLKGKIAGS